MVILKRVKDILFSLNTSLWLMAILLAAFFAGAFIMPVSPEFRTIHSIPLFHWLTGQPLDATWWLWIVMSALFILTLNTFLCSIESVLRKKGVTQWLLLISPQVIHIGFIFMLLAHLFSALGGSQEFVVAREGSWLNLSDSGLRMQVHDIRMTTDARGYLTDWEVAIEYLSGRQETYKDTIKPNKPSLRMGLNVNVKNFSGVPHKAVLLQISREPGAAWALAGSILFAAGILTLIILKVRMER